MKKQNNNFNNNNDNIINENEIYVNSESSVNSDIKSNIILSKIEEI